MELKTELKFFGMLTKWQFFYNLYLLPATKKDYHFFSLPTNVQPFLFRQGFITKHFYDFEFNNYLKVYRTTWFKKDLRCYLQFIIQKNPTAKEERQFCLASQPKSLSPAEGTFLKQSLRFGLFWASLAI